MTIAPFRIGETVVEIVRKDIKNVHLSVHPPTGHVRIAAPHRFSVATLRAFTVSKLKWIRTQQKKLSEQERETPREYVDRESHYVWGERCLLTVTEREGPPEVELRHRRLLLSVRPGTKADGRSAALDAWYRAEVRTTALPLAAEWQRRLGVEVDQIFVRRMKTRWGSAGLSSRSVRLNTDLARKPRACLEFVLVHELVHFLEPHHGARFKALMNSHLPDWPQRRELLNRLPVRHEAWGFDTVN